MLKGAIFIITVIPSNTYMGRQDTEGLLAPALKAGFFSLVLINAFDIH